MHTGDGLRSGHHSQKVGWRSRWLRKAVSIEVAGGLGNQLFSLVAGVFISRQLGVPLRVYVNDVLSGTTISGRGVASFRFFSDSSSLVQEVNYRPSRILRLRQRLNSYLRTFGFRKTSSDAISGFYSPLTVGDDPGIDLVKPGDYVQGYFQAARYFLKVRKDPGFQSFDLQKPSTWFIDSLQDIAIAKPIALHIRRGDYLKPENDFIGALSKTYFLESIKLLRQDPNFINSEVWIFSNDIPMVQAELGEHVEDRVRWITPPSNSSEAESMLLMAKAKALVISNSTFSWWSAALGEPERVIAPSKWFKAAEDPEGLMIPSWERVESSWL